MSGHSLPQVNLSVQGRTQGNAVYPAFILMDGNASSHGTHLVNEFQESSDISKLKWSSRFPDLKSIQHGFVNLRKAIAYPVQETSKAWKQHC
ncbi:hypothetical protein TNCV_4920711 [Trichonephila clavipes]|nr:hypothetical protein TNCV_4920711 [Trichonephila clavipes]